MSDYQELKKHQEEYREELRKNLIQKSPKAIKGAISRLLKELSKHEEEMAANDRSWYPTWSHHDLEVYYENRHLISDSKYEERIEAAMKHYQELLRKESAEFPLLDSDITSD